jgi:hypothetical protein
MRVGQLGVCAAATRAAVPIHAPTSRAWETSRVCAVRSTASLAASKLCALLSPREGLPIKSSPPCQNSSSWPPVNVPPPTAELVANLLTNDEFSDKL